MTVHQHLQWTDPIDVLPSSSNARAIQVSKIWWAKPLPSPPSGGFCMFQIQEEKKVVSHKPQTGIVLLLFHCKSATIDMEEGCMSYRHRVRGTPPQLSGCASEWSIRVPPAQGPRPCHHQTFVSQCALPFGHTFPQTLPGHIMTSRT